MKCFRLVVLAWALAAVSASSLMADPEITTSVPAGKLAYEDYAAAAKVSLVRAVRIAESAVPGKKALSATLAVNSHADGTAYLMWDVDVVSKKRGDVTAVFIDPASGKVIGT